VTMARRFRQLLAEPGVIVAPGVYDGISLKLAETTGFQAGYLTGGGASVAAFGLPDFGLMTMTETVLQAQRMTAVSEMPLICDADTGYGGPANVRRTVRELERAGVAGFHIEDQLLPKRCGFLPNKTLIPTDEFTKVLRVALEARQDPDLVIIARTDALAVEGIDAAIDRANRYHEAGADMVFIEALESPGDLEAIAQRVEAPRAINMIGSSPAPIRTADELTELGFSLAIYPLVALSSAAEAIRIALERLRDEGDDRVIEGLLSPYDLHRFFGLDEWAALGS
jgi:2-methylisocitrate lyase-like PEP mutase family enzyme